MRLVILGAGGFGQCVYEIASQLKKYDKIIFLDDSPFSKAKGRLELFTELIDNNTEFITALGNNSLRLKWTQSFFDTGANIATLLHPMSYVSPSSRLGKGTILLPFSIVNTQSIIGNACIIDCGSIVDHGCVVGDGTHIKPGAIIRPENYLPNAMIIESGQVIEARTYHNA